MSWLVRVLPNRYADSVRLMEVARAVRERDGIDARDAVMGTAANLDALAGLGARTEAGPADVVIAVKAGDSAVGEQALDDAERAASPPRRDGHRGRTAWPRRVRCPWPRRGWRAPTWR